MLLSTTHHPRLCIHYRSLFPIVAYLLHTGPFASILPLKPNLHLMLRLWNMNVGKKRWKLRYELFHPRSLPLATNGCSKSRESQMGPSRCTRPGLWPRVATNLKALIILTLSTLSQKSPPSGFYLHWLLYVVTHFCTGISMRMSTWHSHKAFLLLVLTRFASSSSLCMGWSKPIASGSKSSLMYCFCVAILKHPLTTLCSPKPLSIDSQRCSCMWMISSWPGTLSLNFNPLNKSWIQNFASRILEFFIIFLGWSYLIPARVFPYLKGNIAMICSMIQVCQVPNQPQL